MKCVRITWFIDFSFLIDNCLKLSLTHCFTSGFCSSASFILSIWYCFGFYCINLVPIWGSRFLPTMFTFWPSTIMNAAHCIVPPPDFSAFISFYLEMINSPL